MKTQNKKHNRRVKKLMTICSLCAVLLIVATYAWFIGMKTVNVSSFDIDIASTEGLFLSMDGENWSYKLDAKAATAYEKNTNSWATDGLIPMSTVGELDAASSTMKLFEKGSLTATKGGYRLLASRIHNYDNKDANNHFIEGKGYVAFDLFIQNLSGNEYYVDNEPLNEEAIYLTTNSAVTVAADGGEANTGIENSVRVAFAQIGRVKADTKDASVITEMTCAGKEATETTPAVTGICRNAQIWEPNDKKHVQNAINWYETACLARKNDEAGKDLTKATAYDTEKTTTCGKVTLTDYVNTYAVSRDITVADQVDVYDGPRLNAYTSNTSDSATYFAADAEAKKNLKLVDYKYFTDTDKAKTGVERPTFMTLAPNSITKVRVYIYIEGQDIDNYDFASLGKKISVNFGFTKERFTETDVDYTGPALEEGVDTPVVGD